MKTTVLLSGGLDSTTLLAHLVDAGHQVLCVSFDYGQTHRRELGAAAHFAIHYGVRHWVLHLPRGVFGASALLGDRPMPHGHHGDDSMRATVVPNRNMVMLSMAASAALQDGCEAVAYAAHADDRAIYPDCRSEFIDAMRAALRLCDQRSLTLLTPFVEWSKRDIVSEARRLGVDIDRTWSCYTGGEQPCGVCGACSARQAALA